MNRGIHTEYQYFVNSWLKSDRHGTVDTATREFDSDFQLPLFNIRTPNLPTAEKRLVFTGMDFGLNC